MGSNAFMLSFATALLSLAFLPLPSIPEIVNTEFLYPNFTVSNLQFIANNGTFLSSRNGTYKAAIFNPGGGLNTNFYFSIVHVKTDNIIWSANRDSPISISGRLTLTVNGITILDDNGNLKWSTQSLKSAVKALQLMETGNLVVLDQSNVSLWQSFDYPTDTIVNGQRFPVGASLFSSESETNLSTADYRYTLTNGNVELQWNGLTYWRLSVYTSGFGHSNSSLGYLSTNSTGIYAFSDDGAYSAVVIEIIQSGSDFGISKLDYAGRLKISSFSGSELVQEFIAPIDGCQIPLICGPIGLCSNSTGRSSGTCSCPSGFHNDTMSKGCLPTNSVQLPSACNSTGNGNQPNSSEISFIELNPGIDYFANKFSDPVSFGGSLVACKNLCSQNCSCLAFIYANSSASCYLLKNQLGSMKINSTSSNDRLGYIKTLASPKLNNIHGKRTRNFPMAALVLLPSTAFFLLIILLVVGIRWQRHSKMRLIHFGRENSSSSLELDLISIPGLPVRFNYEELMSATNNFETHIGSGGFGAVYKGTLQDETLVAVKKINNLGIRGKKEFCTEIAVIGNINHVNLVKLRGFCAQGRERLLVYEYMNQGSLERTLFGAEPVIEWQERVDIALGIACGLDYLHSGCEPKIIHCDIKPENILLHDHFRVKISDFGLSKLLSPDQSSYFTALRGTRGYLAPEWMANSPISNKIDVYSYGMVLLEIVSGRRNCPTNTPRHMIDDDSNDGVGGSSLPQPGYFPLFALEMHEQRRYLELADPRLEGRVTSEEVEKLVRVALCCVHEDPVSRPSMARVVGMLEGGVPLGEPRVEALNFLRLYGLYFEAFDMEGSNGGNELMLHPQENGSSPTTPTTAGLHIPFSYISSQQISGPR